MKLELGVIASESSMRELGLVEVISGLVGSRSIVPIRREVKTVEVQGLLARSTTGSRTPGETNYFDKEDSDDGGSLPSRF